MSKTTTERYADLPRDDNQVSSQPGTDQGAIEALYNALEYELFHEVTKDEAQRDAALADLSSLRSAVAQLADPDDDKIVDAIENALEKAHGRSHYECCFNSDTFAYPSADAVKALLRSLLEGQS